MEGGGIALFERGGVCGIGTLLCLGNPKLGGTVFEVCFEGGFLGVVGDAVIGNNSNGSENSDDDDEDEEFDDGEGLAKVCPRAIR